MAVTGHARRFSPAWWCISLVLRLLGAVPQRISVQHEATQDRYDAVVISGGDDISPEHYNGDIQARVKTDTPRDRLEIDWIKNALKWQVPLLGICRGAQLINVVLGGDLHQDIRSMRKHTRNRPGLLPTKQVTLQSASLLSRLTGKTRIRVNSLHHQAIDRPGKGLRIVAVDRDSIVQAVESDQGRDIIGVQWHPEYLIYLPSQLSLFHWLIKKSR